LKDQPGVKFSISDGKIILTGEIAKAKWVAVKQMLDKLKSKGYDLAGLTIK
jgi:nucleoside-triphosphatase THEP1